MGFCARGNLPRLLSPAMGAEWLVVSLRCSKEVVVVEDAANVSWVEAEEKFGPPCHGGGIGIAESGVVTGVVS